MSLYKIHIVEVLTCLQDDLEVWLQYHKRKWALQAAERKQMRRQSGVSGGRNTQDTVARGTRGGTMLPRNSTLGGFLRRAQRTLLNSPWQVVQLARTNELGVFRLWALVGSELHQASYLS